MDDQVLGLPEKTPKYLTEEEVRALVATSLTNLSQPVRVQSNQLASGNFQTGVSGWQIDALGNAEFNAGTFRGTLTASSINIPDSTTASSFHVDSSGNTWWGANVATGLVGAVAYVKNTGEALFTNVTATGAITTGAGSALNGTYLTNNTVTSAKVNVAARGWTQTSVFSVTDSDTVAWGSGTFTASDGTSYSIGTGNTGNMVAKTYVYLDIGTSTTAYQTTTTATTAVGDGKVLIAVAQNNTTEAVFQVFGGNGGINIDASSIVASSITANEIAASTITAGKLSVSQLSAITANMGAITAGTITLDSSGYVRGGQTDYNTGTGFFLGYSGAAYKLSIGDGTAGNSMTWDGSVLTVNGSRISNNSIFGSGADGTFALDGTNIYATYMSKSGANYTLLMDVYATDFTMSSTATLTTAGYRLFVNGTLTLGASNVIKWNGNTGSNGTNGGVGSSVGSGGAGASALTSTNLYGGPAGYAGAAGGAGGTGGGGSGSTGSTGTSSAALTHSFATSNHSVSSGNGGAGGAQGGGGRNGSGGSAGGIGGLTASSVRPYSARFGVSLLDEASGATPSYLTYYSGVGGAGGAGGGGEGCTGAQGGGGGGGGGSGSSGGTVMIASKIIVNAGVIQAIGGNGGNGGTGGNGLGGASCGGGGHGGGGGGGGGAGSGGSGGVLVLIYQSLTGAGTTSVAGGSAGTVGSGGTGGTGTSGGNNGSNGASGAAGSTGPTGSLITMVV